jgi:hypothetical protein
MYYTDEMAKAFHSVKPIEGFELEVYDTDDYLTLLIKVEQIMDISEEKQADIVQYLLEVKKALEGAGAIVLFVREALDDGSEPDN